IMPAVEMAGHGGWWQPLVGVGLGVLLIALLDKITPHLHHLTGISCEYGNEEPHAINNKSINRVLLFVIAIAIHKFPEGLATGVVFDGDNIGNAYTVAITIALQNIPEGMVIVTPLLMIGVGYTRVIAVSLLVALMETIGVLLGYLIGDISSVLLPTMTAIAGGAMLYVISDEMIPETHSHGYQKQATYALVAGVMCMLYVQMLV
ncbi:MAG: ZIP family metal transporter, partial [Prevotella sp.]